MLDARDYLTGNPKGPSVADHHETDQLSTVIGPDHMLSKNKAGKLALDRFEVFPVVPESLPLPNRRLVEDCGHPSYEGVVEERFPDFKTFLFGLANEVPNSRFDLRVPPVLIILDRKYRQMLPIHRIFILGFESR